MCLLACKPFSDCCCAVLSCPVMSDSLRPHGLPQSSPAGSSVHGDSPGNRTGGASPSAPQLLAFSPGKEQAAGVWETCLAPGWPQLRSRLPFGPRSQASLQKAQGPGVCKLPKPPASRALCQAKRAPRAAFPSGCLAAQTKRWAEGIRVPGPLAGGGSTTARGKLRLCPASACQTGLPWSSPPA